ncbi:unnamed protein product [Phyllotreta striolata]|uniref:Uncharacterized protein n=1 Tax=Phyllotreta striolata TaxID=444603 RepID=A0A9N9U0A9_PHYSR|nr:unnamed protein product [Phyllotreta striolata]
MSLDNISSIHQQNVPVHRTNTKKTLSANFIAKRYNSTNHRNGKTTTILANDEPARTEIIVETLDNPENSKKRLARDNRRLTEQNQLLASKFNELEQLSVRKITKLREKVNVLQLANAHFKQDIEELERTHDTVLQDNERLSAEIQRLKVCERCREYRLEIEATRIDNDNYKKANESIEGRSDELREDLQMLKIVVFRLNSQLERYQELLRRNNIPKPLGESHHKRDLQIANFDSSKDITSELHKDHKHAPILWGGVNRHTLGPLLDAYEDTVKEKDEIIEEYESEMAKFAGRTREIIDENETLYRRLNEDEHCSAKLGAELSLTKAESKALKEQNDALVKKCSLKQDKLEEVLKIYEAKVDQMSRDYDVLHGEYVKIKTENAALAEKSKSCSMAQEELKNQMRNFIPISVHTSSVNECKKWYEELKRQYDGEKEKLQETVNNYAKNVEDLNKEISNLNSAKEKLESTIIQLEKHIKKLEAKQADTEHNLNGVQLSRGALKKQLHKAMEFARDMVTEQEVLLKALNQRQIENKAVKKVGSDMASRMDFLKCQLKDVQKNAWQDFVNVEQTIQEQAVTIETMKDKYEKEIEELRKVIARYEGEASKPENVSMAHYFLLKNKYK